MQEFTIYIFTTTVSVYSLDMFPCLVFCLLSALTAYPSRSEPRRMYPERASYHPVPHADSPRHPSEAAALLQRAETMARLDIPPCVGLYRSAAWELSASLEPGDDPG